MKLFFISQPSDYVTWDTYDSAVVVAESEEAATTTAENISGMRSTMIGAFIERTFL